VISNKSRDQWESGHEKADPCFFVSKWGRSEGGKEIYSERRKSPLYAGFDKKGWPNLRNCRKTKEFFSHVEREVGPGKNLPCHRIRAGFVKDL